MRRVCPLIWPLRQTELFPTASSSESFWWARHCLTCGLHALGRDRPAAGGEGLADWTQSGHSQVSFRAPAVDPLVSERSLHLPSQLLLLLRSVCQHPHASHCPAFASTPVHPVQSCHRAALASTEPLPTLGRRVLCSGRSVFDLALHPAPTASCCALRASQKPSILSTSTTPHIGRELTQLSRWGAP